jgi:hypothetical protein
VPDHPTKVLAIPDGATWVLLRDDEDEPTPDGPEPEPTFGFGEPPAGKGAWEEPGH